MKSSSKNHFRLIAVLACAVVICAIGGFYRHLHQARSNFITHEITIDGTVLPQTRKIYPFNLTDNRGKPFTKDSLKGHWTLMFFGFTNCGYVCPTTLSALNKMFNNLKAHLSPPLLPEVVLVSVDPERDSVKRMNDYVKSFNPAFRGARADMEETKTLANQMSVVFDKVAMPNGNYMVNHSTEIMLLDPEGNLRAFLSSPHVPDHMVRDYEAVIRAYSHP